MQSKTFFRNKKPSEYTQRQNYTQSMLAWTLLPRSVKRPVKLWNLDPNTKRFKRLFILTRTHSMQIFGEIPLFLFSVLLLLYIYYYYYFFFFWGGGGGWNLELGFEFLQVEEFSQTDRQRIQDKWIDETERMLTKRFKITFQNFQKLLAWGWEGEMNT